MSPIFLLTKAVVELGVVNAVELESILLNAVDAVELASNIFEVVPLEAVSAENLLLAAEGVVVMSTELDDVPPSPEKALSDFWVEIETIV